MDKDVMKAKEYLNDVRHNLAYLLDHSVTNEELDKCLDNCNFLLNLADMQLDEIKRVSQLIAVTLDTEHSQNHKNI